MNGSRELSIEAKFVEKRRAWESHAARLETRHRIYLGDARLMAQPGSQPSIHLIVTSPPYWNLKEYPAGVVDQLGNLPDYQQFLSELHAVWTRCWELLIPGGRMCVVVGDVAQRKRERGEGLSAAGGRGERE